MDSSSSSSSSSSSQALYTSASSPRSKELQGPRPTPLRVRKDSHKVKKPPIPPPPSHFSQPNTTTNNNNNTSFQQQQHRTTPLIIYTISPKVIHTNPEDFMTLVQRLTSADNTQLGASSTPISGGGLISPAARYAVMDKINTYQQTLNSTGGGCTQDDIILGPSSSSVDHLERATSNMQFVPSGILSPGPASLAPNNFLFSPLSSDPNSMSNFFQGLSPMMNHNQQQVITNNKEIINFNGISSIPSPGTNNLFLSPSIMFSPTVYSLDLFNNFGDHL